jgi:hypothetical protein
MISKKKENYIPDLETFFPSLTTTGISTCNYKRTRWLKEVRTKVLQMLKVMEVALEIG